MPCPSVEALVATTSVTLDSHRGPRREHRPRNEDVVHLEPQVEVERVPAWRRLTTNLSCSRTSWSVSVHPLGRGQGKRGQSGHMAVCRLTLCPLHTATDLTGQALGLEIAERRVGGDPGQGRQQLARRLLLRRGEPADQGPSARRPDARSAASRASRIGRPRSPLRHRQTFGDQLNRTDRLRADDSDSNAKHSARRRQRRAHQQALTRRPWRS